MKSALVPVVLMFASCTSTADRPRTIENPVDSPGRVVAELYDLVTFGAGTTPDWDEVRSLFIEEAVVVLARDALR